MVGNWLTPYVTIGCPKKSARFNLVINPPFIQKVLIFLFHYKVRILRLILEHNIRQMSLTTLLSGGGRQRAHFKSCVLVGTPHTFLNTNFITVQMKFWGFLPFFLSLFIFIFSLFYSFSSFKFVLFDFCRVPSASSWDCCALKFWRCTNTKWRV